MKKKQYVCRVVLPTKEALEKNNTYFLGAQTVTSEVTTLLENLRYAGLIMIHRDDEDAICFDLLCPHGLQSDVWAEQNAARMTSFGYNAVKAPRTFLGDSSL